MELGDESSQGLIPVKRTLQERYLQEMKKLQFGTKIQILFNNTSLLQMFIIFFSTFLPAFFDMIVEDEENSGIKFTVSHHYEGNVRSNFSRSFPARLKRLAQESITLSTSLPIAYGSAIFVRCDSDRLDVMKVRTSLFIPVCLLKNSSSSLSTNASASPRF